MAKDTQKTEDQEFSRRMMWVALGALALPLIILVIVFLVMDWPFGDEAGDGTMWLVALAVIAIMAAERLWPKVKAWALARGVPPWVFDEGWRSSALLAALLSVFMLSVAALTNEEDTWFTGLGTVLAFLVGFAVWFSWFYVIPTAWRRWRANR